MLVGVFVLGLAALMLFIGIWLSTQGRNEIYVPYLVYVQGGVDGLTAKSPVQFNGVRVGYVDSIKLSPKNPQLVELILQLDQNIPITESTTATLVPQGITGLVYVGLQAGRPASTTPLLAKTGQRYPVIKYQEPLLQQLSTALPEIAQNIQRLSLNFNKIFTDKNTQDFAKTLDNLATVTQAVRDNERNIRDTLSYLKEITHNTKVATTQLDSTIKVFKQAGQSINNAGLAATQAIQNGNALMNSIDQQMLPTLSQTLEQLQEMSSDLRQFSSDISQNPSILIRGKKSGSSEW